MFRLKKVTKEREYLAVSQLAHEIWREHYSGLLSMDQIEYMLDKYQSVAAIKRAVAEGYEYYLIKSWGVSVGYFSIKMCEPQGKAFISKLYVKKEYRGKGFARKTIDEAADMARDLRLQALWLNVNKENTSVQRYHKLGFEVTEAVVTDIGGGYVMDDYIMEKKI